MILRKLYEILDETTTVAEVIEGEPLEPGITGNDKWVDCYLFTVVVDLLKAAHFRGQFMEMMRLLDVYPLIQYNYCDITTMKEVVGDQEHGLQVFALGAVLECWEIKTPKDFSFPANAEIVAKHGGVFITNCKAADFV